MTSRPILPEQIAAISYEIADSLEPDMRRAFLAIVNVLKDTVPLSRLEAMLRAGNFSGIIQEYEAAIASVLQLQQVEDFIAVHRQVFGVSLRTALVEATILPIFESATNSALARLEHHAGGLIQAITEDTLASVQEILSSASIEGLGAQATARLLRSAVPVLPRHARAVLRFANEMREIGLPPQEVTRLSEIYAERLLRWRAETIARTEVIHASMSSQVSLWQQMVDEGLFINERTWMEWQVTEDDALCEFCAPMDGQRVRIYDSFLSSQKGFPSGRPKAKSTIRERKTPLRPDPRRTRNARTRARAKPIELRPLRNPKRVSHPPLHPRCRCTLVLRFD